MDLKLHLNRILTILEESVLDLEEFDNLKQHTLEALSVFYLDNADDLDKHPVRWILLPGISASASGGDFKNADKAAIAWLLQYYAAHMLDSIADRDSNSPWIKNQPDAVLLNVATALYFLSLRHLSLTKRTGDIAGKLTEEFIQCGLVMANGQHRDFLIPSNLTNYFEVAHQKSGVFFQLACRAGAISAKSTDKNVEILGNYGYAIGMLLQLHDDMKDIYESENLCEQLYDKQTLVDLYMMEVSGIGKYVTLRKKWFDQQIPNKKILEYIEQKGFFDFLQFKHQEYHNMAVSMVKQIEINSVGSNDLLTMIPRFAMNN